MTSKNAGNIAVAILSLLLLAVLPSAVIKTMGFTKSNPQKITTVTAKAVYAILIDADENKLFLLKDGKLFKSYKCATGKSSTPSPLGAYKIVKKSLWGEGFGGYYLGINCKWGEYGIHGTTEPDSVGHDASHGCFRMLDNDISELYSYVGIGTQVVIAAGVYGVFGSSFRIIGPDMYGLDVLKVQHRLRDLGYFKGYCNGRYDSSGFYQALCRFQQDNDLPVSGYVTRKTYAAMGFVMIE